MINNESNDCMENDDDGKNENSEHGRISNTNDKKNSTPKRNMQCEDCENHSEYADCILKYMLGHHVDPRHLGERPWDDSD